MPTTLNKCKCTTTNKCKEDQINNLRLLKKITDGSDNEAVDGSGWNPSINNENAEKAFLFIKNKMSYIDWEQANVLDAGCGHGHFTKYLNENNINCLGAEGSLSLEKNFVDSDNIVVWDLCQDIHKLNLDEKLFDVSVSFEVAEHIPMSMQVIFWENMKKLSRYHFCSIHTENGVNEYHKCMMPEWRWMEFFETLNIKIKDRVSKKDWAINVSPWQCSCFFVLEF